MKYYEKGSLQNIIYKDKKFRWSIEFVHGILTDLAVALQAMHERGIVHNDIKVIQWSLLQHIIVLVLQPGNVLVDYDRRTKKFTALVCDFSISYIHDDELMGVKAMRRSNVKGASTSYAPPEIFVQKHRNGKRKKMKSPFPVDIYSFGITAYEALSRRPPWRNMEKDEIKAAVIDGKRPEFPLDIERLKQSNALVRVLIGIIAECWSQSASDRPSAASLVRQMKRLAEFKPPEK